MTRRTVESLQRSLNYEYIGLFLVNDTGDYAHLYTTSKLEAEYGRHRFIKIGFGIVGWSIAHSQLVNVPDVLADSRHLSGITDTRSEMCVPLRVGERVIGALDLQSTRLNAFTADDERLLTTVASQWAVMLENAKLYVVERQRRQHLESLQATAAAINAELDLNALFDLIVEEATRTFGAPAVSLLILNSDAGRLKVQASRGVSAAFKSTLTVAHEQLGLRLEAGWLPVPLEDLPASTLREDPVQLRLFEAEDICGLMRVPMTHAPGFSSRDRLGIYFGCRRILAGIGLQNGRD